MRGVAHLTTLTYLELNDNQVKRLEELEGMHRLEVLDCSYNRIKTVKGLLGLGNLTRLYLASNRLSAIEGLEALGKLTVLDLGNNSIRVGRSACLAQRGVWDLPACVALGGGPGSFEHIPPFFARC